MIEVGPWANHKEQVRHICILFRAGCSFALFLHFAYSFPIILLFAGDVRKKRDNSVSFVWHRFIFAFFSLLCYIKNSKCSRPLVAISPPRHPPILVALSEDFADNCFYVTVPCCWLEEILLLNWWYSAEQPLYRSRAVKAFRKTGHMRTKRELSV